MRCGHSAPHWHGRKFSAPLSATPPRGKFREIVNEQMDGKKMLQMDIKTKRQTDRRIGKKDEKTKGQYSSIQAEIKLGSVWLTLKKEFIFFKRKLQSPNI